MRNPVEIDMMMMIMIITAMPAGDSNTIYELRLGRLVLRKCHTITW